MAAHTRPRNVDASTITQCFIFLSNLPPPGFCTHGIFDCVPTKYISNVTLKTVDKILTSSDVLLGG